MTVQIVKQGGKTVEHTCDLPNYWWPNTRKRDHEGELALCDVCGQLWEYGYQYGEFYAWSKPHGRMMTDVGREHVQWNKKMRAWCRRDQDDRYTVFVSSELELPWMEEDLWQS